jgi:hypothetical protein
VNPVKKLIISISVTLILFSSALFLLQENIVTLKSKKIRDVIGRNVEQRNFEKTDIMIFGLKRFIGITEKKISFLLKTMEPEWVTAKGGDRKIRLFFADFVNSDPYCKRIRIVNPQLEILFSTAPQDISRSRLNVNLYGSIFKDLPPTVSRVVVDPIVEMIIFYEVITGNKGERYAVLFYYSQDALEGVFARIEGLNARSFLITNEKIMLVNFPEIDESEQANLSNLVRAISQNESGALRVIMKEMDKTIYYRRLQGQYTDWTMGLTLDTERLRISRIGVLILVVQALVIVSVLLFVLFSLSKLGSARRRALEVEREKPPGAPAHAAPAALGGEGPVSEGAAAEASALRTQAAGVTKQPVEGQRGGADAVGLGATATAVEAAPSAAGVMSLSDIEELVNVEEIGEAEVAGMVEEVEDVHEMESLGDEGLEEEPGVVEEFQDLEPEPAEEVEELDELEEVGDEESARARAAAVVDEAIIDDRGTATGAREAVAGDAGRVSGERTLPELQALVAAGRPNKEEEEERTIKLPPTIPEEVYREKGGVEHDDELSALITEIETKVEAPQALKAPEELKAPMGPAEAPQAPHVSADLEELPDLRSPEGLALFIKGVLRTVGITKGALLTQAEGGLFEPNTIFGLSKITKKKLVFDGGENVYAEFLKKGKTLFIREKVFKSKEVAKKFDRTDSSKIRSLIMSPVVKSGDLKGILIAGVSKGKKVDQESIIEKIKKIKEVIVRVF